MTDPRPFGYPAGVPRPKLPKEAVLAPQTPARRNKTTRGKKGALTPNQIKWRAQKAKSDAAAAEFKRHCVDAGLPLPVREYRFAYDATGREWEADFCWPDERLILEVEGGAWRGGRHTFGKGYLEDMEKYNTMTVLGFWLLRCTPKTLNDPDTIAMVARVYRSILP